MQTKSVISLVTLCCAMAAALPANADVSLSKSFSLCKAAVLTQVEPEPKKASVLRRTARSSDDLVRVDIKAKYATSETRRGVCEVNRETGDTSITLEDAE